MFLTAFSPERVLDTLVERRGGWALPWWGKGQPKPAFAKDEPLAERSINKSMYNCFRERRPRPVYCLVLPTAALRSHRLWAMGAGGVQRLHS